MIEYHEIVYNSRTVYQQISTDSRALGMEYGLRDSIIGYNNRVDRRATGRDTIKEENRPLKNYPWSSITKLPITQGHVISKYQGTTEHNVSGMG